MDVVNFPGIIAQHGLLTSAQIDLAKDLLLIGKRTGPQRDGTQYDEMAISIQQFAALVGGGGGNENLAQTLVLGNTTGGTNIVVSDGDAVGFVSGAFTGNLVPTIFTGNHTWTLPDATGTIALLSDIPATPTTLYSGDGSTTGARTVTLGGTLQFNHGAAGVNGYVQTAFGGYFKNQTATATNYFEFNHNTNVFTVQTATASVSGFTATNNAASLDLQVGSGGRAYIGLNAGVGNLDFNVNNGAIIAGTLTNLGKWIFGGLTGNIARATFNGTGNTVATVNTIWNNLSGIEQMRFTDNGVLCIGTNTPASYLGTANKIHIDSVVATDYTPTAIFHQYYNNSANNTNSVTGVISSVYKGTAFNTLELRASTSIARNDGAGSMLYMYGHESYVWNIGAATINSAFAYSARCQIRDGVVTNWGGLDISFQENNAPAVVTNMIGVLVRSPVNVSGITVTNTYGMLVQSNLIGVNNYAYTSAGRATSGLGTITPNQQAMLHITANHDPVFKAHVYFKPITAAQASTIIPSDGMKVYVSDTNGTFTSVGFWGREAGVWIKL